MSTSRWRSSAIKCNHQVQSSAIKRNQVQSIVIERNQVQSTHDVDEPLATVGAAEGRRHERDGKLVLKDDALHLGGRAHLMRGAINLQSACNQHAISGHHRNQRLHTLTGTQHAISCHPSLSAVTYVEGHAERQARGARFPQPPLDVRGKGRHCIVRGQLGG